MATLTPYGATMKHDDYARLGAALAAIAQRTPPLALPSPAARHLLAAPKPAQNPYPPHIGELRPLYNF